MRKKMYIEPKMRTEELSSHSSLMIPGSPGLDQNTNYNPGAPKRISPTNPVAAADTVQVF